MSRSDPMPLVNVGLPQPPFAFTCRFCRRPVTVTESDYEAYDAASLFLDLWFDLHFIRCPSPGCRKLHLLLSLHDLVRAGSSVFRQRGPLLASRWLIPDHSAKVFPDYVPEPIRADYAEARKIVSLSPRAAATLARRALQGMIRDVFSVSRRNLYEEIDAIQPRVDPATWNAIDAVRHTGNVGAHMQADVNVIVDVDSGEAGLLTELIEVLVHDWYEVPHERQELMKRITEVGDQKAHASGKTVRRHPATESESKSKE